MTRYLPDTEESQHVVYAVGIEILVHVLEASHPPLAAVLEHGIPVICREAPVLSVDREVIWRCSRLVAAVEVLRFLPHITAVGMHADRYVALQNDALTACILMRRTHLAGEQILYEIVICRLLIYLGARVKKRRAVCLVPCIMVGPAGEVGGMILITHHAIHGVRHKPLLLLLKPCLEVLTAQHCCPLLSEELAQVLLLGTVDTLIVYHRQGVEFLAQGLKLCHARSIAERRQLAQVHILRMQGEDADT